jgi:hypothetical protein
MSRVSDTIKGENVNVDAVISNIRIHIHIIWLSLLDICIMRLLSAFAQLLRLLSTIRIWGNESFLSWSGGFYDYKTLNVITQHIKVLTIQNSSPTYIKVT